MTTDLRFGMIMKMRLNSGLDSQVVWSPEYCSASCEYQISNVMCFEGSGSSLKQNGMQPSDSFQADTPLSLRLDMYSRGP